MNIIKNLLKNIKIKDLGRKAETLATSRFKLSYKNL